MKRDSKTKKRLLDENHQMLSATELLNAMLSELVNPPGQAKQAIIAARDETLKAHISELEKTITS